MNGVDMEALEEKYTRHDSFEEVDRILAIVENSKSEFDKGKERMLPVFIILFANMCFSALSVIFLEEKGEAIFKDNNVVSLVTSYVVGVLLIGMNFTIFYYGFIVNRHFSEKAAGYRLTTSEATEVLRELLPSLSRSEHWSSLRKFELRLRLSKLDISSEKLFSENTF